MPTIEIAPFSQARPRFGKHGNVRDPSAKLKKDLGYALLNARQRAKSSILEGDLFLDVTFFITGSRGDLDNYLKAFMDAANGILWKDDSQVVHIWTSVQRYSSKAQIDYELTSITEWENKPPLGHPLA